MSLNFNNRLNCKHLIIVKHRSKQFVSTVHALNTVQNQYHVVYSQTLLVSWTISIAYLRKLRSRVLIGVLEWSVGELNVLAGHGSKNVLDKQPLIDGLSC